MKLGLGSAEKHGLIDFAFSYFGEPPLPQQMIYTQVFNFHSWLASEGKAAVIDACQNYNR